MKTLEQRTGAPASRRLTAWACGLLIAAAVSQLAGCSTLGYLLYLVAPNPTETVAAEFDDLDNHRVAIVIFADQQVLYEYPFVRLTLATTVSSELRRHLENVEVVDPACVIRYQDERLNWDVMEKTKLGRDLGADRVLYLALVEYTMREAGSLQLFRGRIYAEAGLYDVALDESTARLWDCPEIRVTYPEDSPVGIPGDDDRGIRADTERRFAKALVEKFREHEAPEER